MKSTSFCAIKSGDPVEVYGLEKFAEHPFVRLVAKIRRADLDDVYVYINPNEFISKKSDE